MVIFVVQIRPQLNKGTDEDFCSNFNSKCNECIRNAKCQWCSKQKNENVYGKNCFSSKIDLSKICYFNEMENPVNNITVKKNDPLSVIEKGKTNYASDKIVQFKPQVIKLRLRKGHPINVSIHFRQVPDYPLDLYYLMDLSNSMEPHKETLAKVGRKLAGTMRKLTSQFKIGFGSFVDKVMLPFVNIHPDALRNPCKGCATPFSFRNNLPLTEDDALFKTKVEEAQISTNIDSPEGGLDALMQTIVCKKEIGWRKQVRKIVVFSTDAQFHAAGDGKLAGVVEPNDGQCHMDGGSVYEKYDLYDYPSVSHINEVTKQNGVNIIFAVKRYDKLYKQLADIIDGASYAPLTADPKNIIEVIENVYNNITSNVEIKERNSTHENLFALRMFSNCKYKDKKVNNFLICSKVTEGEMFEVTFEIELKDCPKSQLDRKSIILIGTKEETVKLEIDMMCDCKCEKKLVSKDKTAHCSLAGYQQCGVCKCDKKHFGDTCQCTKDSNFSGGQIDTGKCKPGNAAQNDPVCSGKGGCICEKCSCWEKDAYGKYCQWDKANCRKTPTSELCSAHGTCEEDRCQCNVDWVGNFCECPHSRECVAKGDSAKCSGVGECICGRCSCSVRDGVRYTGEFCEDCPSCDGSKCLTFRPCIQCSKWRSGSLNKQECDMNCTSLNMLTKKTMDDYVNSGARLCTFTDASTNCDFNFTYKYISKGKYQLIAQSLQKCPGEVDVFAVVFGVIGGIVGLGVLTLLIWKLLTNVHDEREYSRFMEEYESQKWATTSSPLYNPATTETTNPAYGN